MEKTYSLTIYLIKSDLHNIDDFVKTDIKQQEIRNLGVLFYKDSHGGKPKWSGLFEGYNLNLYSSSASGLLIVEVDDRFLAITFGPEGRYFLKRGVYEERFGLITTLNSVKEESIRSIDTKTLESEGLQSRIQSPQPVSTDAFGIDVEKDFLNCVVGESEDKRLGKILAGRDSLRVSIKCTIGNLRDYLRIILSNFKKEDYKKKFSWVDNLKEIKDPSKLNELNSILITEINRKSPEKLWLTIPEILDWSDHGGFKYLNRKKEDLYDDIHISNFKTFSEGQITLNTLKNSYIYRYSQSNNYTKDHWRVYECIYFEYSEDRETYFLTSGKWYAVNNSLVSSVNNYYSTLPRNIPELIFPNYNHENENKYNIDLAGKNKALCLDKKTISIVGNSSFEFCDIYTKYRYIIHVKKYSGSEALSHLFNQGFVSANLFLDIKFRQRINEKLLDKDFTITDVSKRPNVITGEYKVVFGIISKSNSPLDIPFFSKITLMHISKTLQNLGYEVFLIKIKNDRPNKNDN